MKYNQSIIKEASIPTPPPMKDSIRETSRQSSVQTPTERSDDAHADLNLVAIKNLVFLYISNGIVTLVEFLHFYISHREGYAGKGSEMEI